MLASSRAKAILKYLKKHGDFVTVSYIAQKLKVTERTIYREMSDVNQIVDACGAVMETIQGKGMRLLADEHARNRLDGYLQERKSEYIPNAEERVDLVIIELLNRSDYLKTQALAIEINSSLQTIRNDLKQIEAIVKHHNLELQAKKGEGIRLVGNAVLKHHLLASICLRNIEVESFFAWMRGELQSGHAFIALLKAGGYEPLFQMNCRILQSALEGFHGMQITDSHFQELIILSALMLKRNREGQKEYEAFAFFEEANTSLTGVSKKIIQRLEAGVPVSLSKEEKEYLYWLACLTIGEQEGGSAIHKREFLLAPSIRTFISLVQERLGIYLKDDVALTRGLMRHIDKALSRIRNGVSVSNPIKEEIRKNYDELYSMIEASVKEIFPHDIFPDDEISYMVLYFAVSLDKTTRRSFRVLVVCTSGMGSSKMLASRLEREIAEIDIKKNISMLNLHEEMLEQYDLILSTVPLPLQAGSYIMVSPLLLDKELEMVKEAIRRHKHRHLKRIEKRHLKVTSENAVDELKWMREMSGWAIHLLEQFEVVAVTTKELETAVDAVDYLERHLYAKGLITHPQRLRQFIKENNNATSFLIPNTQLGYFEGYFSEIKQPVILVYHFEPSYIGTLFSIEAAPVSSMIIMLCPDKRVDAMMQFLGEITMLMIEEADTIHLFEIGDRENLVHLIGQRVKQYIIESIS